MDIPLLLKALILGIVEGLTEFLPISSTGHLIIVGQWLDFNDEKGKIFEVVIQTGAMLAIVWEYRRKFAGIILGLPHDARARQFVMSLAIAFMPAALLGLAFGKYIKAALFKPVPVAIAFIVGGFIILWAEKRTHRIAVEIGAKYPAGVLSRVSSSRHLPPPLQLHLAHGHQWHMPHHHLLPFYIRIRIIQLAEFRRSQTTAIE